MGTETSANQAFSLKGKVVLVTGGSSGIGRASALAFARRGAQVVVAANVSVEGGEETVRLIQDMGGEASFVQADVCQASDVEALMNTVIEIYGRLDYAYNNAGVNEGAANLIADTPEEVWDRVINVNLKGVWLCMKYEIPQMLQQGGGAIVNTSSVGGFIGFPGFAAYVASKHGVIGLTKTAALEYAKAGIRVNAVAPGVIPTGMMLQLFESSAQMEATMVPFHPLGRLGTPDEVAQAVVWLCSDAASFVTGHVLSVDGGWVAQ
jgi:NAD(P)-dependent dehydrogenase (short-subunit alcohol dehydrogenase family)